MSADLISWRAPRLTAVTPAKPGLAVTRPGANLLPRHDPAPRARRARPFGEDVRPSRDLHQFGHPADAADHRVVPFLEIDTGTPRQPCGLPPDLLDAPGEI